MTYVADYMRPIAPATLKAAGVSGVCRYISWQNRDPLRKVMYRAEFEGYVNNGIQVTANWEFDAQDCLGGAALGGTHGREWVRQVKELGLPAGKGCAAPGSCDFDISWNQWAGAAGPYYREFAKVLRGEGYVPGIYGPRNALMWAHDQGSADLFWQAAMSWAWAENNIFVNPRAGNFTIDMNKILPYVHLVQTNHVTIGGQDCDRNVILKPDYGQYPGAGGVSTAPALVDATPALVVATGKRLGE